MPTRVFVGPRILILAPFFRSFLRHLSLLLFVFFFLNDPATPEISTLPLPDALPICGCRTRGVPCGRSRDRTAHPAPADGGGRPRGGRSGSGRAVFGSRP